MIFLLFIFNVSAAKNTWDPGTVNQVFSLPNGCQLRFN